MLKGMDAPQIALAVLGIAALIAWHELGHYTLARLLGMRVLKYSIGFGPKIWGFTKNEIEYQIAALPLGGFVQIKGMSALEEGAVGDPKSFIMRPRWARWVVLAAGPGFNYLMAALLFFVSIAAWPSPVDTPVIEVTEVVAGQPAALAGMQTGDMVMSVDGSVPREVSEFKQLIGAKAGAPVVMHVRRGEVESDITITPAPLGNGFVIGVAPMVRYAMGGPLKIAGASINKCYTESVSTLQAFGALFRREPGADIGGPVMMVSEIKTRLAHGPRQFVYILALLSVNLGLLNLLPVPSLDGIKMLFLTVEGATRRNLHAGFQVWVNAIGLIALLGLTVVLMARDTLKLLG